MEIKSAWLALRVDERLYNIKANSFLSKLTLELRVFERVCALIIYFLFEECSHTVWCALRRKIKTGLDFDWGLRRREASPEFL